MKAIKKTAGLAQDKTVNIAKATVLKKFKSPLNVNFPIAKSADFNDCEISIKVEGGHIKALFFLKGELVSQQALPVKKIPNPPPFPKDEIIKALEQLRFNFNIQK